MSHVLSAGETNAFINTDLYNCTFPALIADWRKAFHAGSDGQTQPLFPFGFVQVSGSQGTDRAMETVIAAQIQLLLAARFFHFTAEHSLVLPRTGREGRAESV